ncbi:lasso RiPP family leader peptide-containing protein [Parasphingorhabdus sp.]
MNNETNQQNETKAIYEKPELEDHGSLAEHTQSGNFTGSAGDLGSS